MEFHGIKIDLVGLAAAITAVASLLSVLKGHKQKEKNNARKDESR